MKAIILKKTWGLVLAASMLASVPLLAIGKDSDLDKQVQNYWSARTKHDWGAVYDLLTAKEKATSTREQYIKSSNETIPFDYSNAQVKEMEIAGDLAWVDVAFDAKIIRYPDAPARHVQTWQLWQKTDTWHPVTENDKQPAPTLPPKLRLIAEESTLTSRAKSAWESKTRQDWKSFYSFLSPAYRAIVSLEDFLKKKAQYLYPSSHIDWAEVAQSQKDKGSVAITFAIKPNDAAASKAEAQEKSMVEDWIKQNGEWYFDIPLPQNTATPAQAAPAEAKP